MIREDYRAIARTAKEIKVAEALREVAMKNLLAVVVRVGVESAVEKYMQSPEFEDDATWWARIQVTAPDGEETEHAIAIDPQEPACDSEGGEHDWDEGGPWGGDNGGVAWTSTCRHCGLRKHEQSRGSCTATGQAMGPSVCYLSADEDENDDDHDEDDE